MLSPKREAQKRACTVCGEVPKTDSHGQKCQKESPVRTSVQSPNPRAAQPGSQTRPPYSPYVCGKPLGRALSTENLSPHPEPLSLAELPRLVATVGPDVALGEGLWLEGPRLMASALGVHIPVSTVKVQPEEETVHCPADTDVPLEKPTEDSTIAKKVKHRVEPLTGMQVLDIMCSRRHCGKIQFVHLNAVKGSSYRPYDLRVVPRSQAGPEHYVFSPTCVLHVRDGCSVGVATLEEWRREATLWGVLRGIPFFRDYLLRKAFSWWHKNVRRIIIRRRCGELRGQLLVAVPQFRDALLQVSRLIEELKQVPWLPRSSSHSRTLLEFQDELLRKNGTARGLLAKFLQYRALVLSVVQEECYGIHQDLQHQVDGFHMSERSRPTHLQLRSLRGELGHAERTLLLLGNVAALVDHMIVQNLVTIIIGEVGCFVNRIIGEEQSQEVGVFQAELVFGASDQLTLSPPIHLLQEALWGAVLSVADTTLQVFDSCNGFPEPEEHVNMTTSCSNFPWGLTSEPTSMNTTELPDSQAPRVVLPKLSSLRIEGKRLRGESRPLSRKKLEWQLSLNSYRHKAEEGLARITEEAAMEVQQLCDGCSWLVDVHVFTCQWSPADLEAMKGWSSQCYSEQIRKARAWKERLLALSTFHTTSNKLLTVRCSSLQETLVRRLTSIEEDVLTLLAVELKERSENLLSQLRKTVEGLRAEPEDLCDFTHFFSLTRSCERKSEDFQRQLQYLLSLREAICVLDRPLEEQEVQLQKQLLDLWNHFGPLLKQAMETASERLPSILDALDRAFPSLVRELDSLVSEVTSGPYLDPSQKGFHMVSQLMSASKRFSTLETQLGELGRASQTLRGKTLDLSFVEAAKLKLESRTELWKLLRASTAQIQEWKHLAFRKFKVHQAQEKVGEWLRKTMVLARTIPSSDAVFRKTEQLVEEFSQQLSVLRKLSRSSLKPRHWRRIFKGITLLNIPEKTFTVADLLSNKVLENPNKISKICQEAKAEANMEQVFQKLQRSWKETLLCLDDFAVWREENPLKESVRQNGAPAGQSGHYSSHMQNSYHSSIISGLEDLKAQAEDGVMTLSVMLLSPYVSEFKEDVEHWVQLLQELEELLDLWGLYHEKWFFLNTVLCKMGVSSQTPELVQKFRPVDDLYQEMIQNMAVDPHVLSFVHPVYVEMQRDCRRLDPHAVLTEGLSIMEEISVQLLYLLDPACRKFPRLCVLSDREAVELLALDPTPSSLLPVVRKCFRGVRWLEISSFETKETDVNSSLKHFDKHLGVWGVIGCLGEKVSFPQPLETNLDCLAWLSQLEKQLKSTMVHLIWECTAAHKSPEAILPEKSPGDFQVREDTSQTDEVNSLWNLLSKFPLQCILVAEEAIWCGDMQEAFLKGPRSSRASLRIRYTAKLRSLCHMIWNGFSGSSEKTHGCCYMVSALRALIVLTMRHNHQISGLVDLKNDLVSSFEWHKILKYHFDYQDQRSQSNSDAVHADNYSKEQYCCVDILGTRLPYGYEYVGPDDWMMVSTLSTDRVSLGVLLAITSFRCGFVTGPSMSGKSKTIAHLGHALGQHVITLCCCQEMSSGVILKMLCGALQTGTWLVLDAVDLLSQGMLSVLGQHLSDIYVSLSAMQDFSQRRLGSFCSEEIKITTDTGESGVPFSESLTKSSEFCCSESVLLAGKPVLPKYGYGCVMISSALCMSEVPENLRAATRPISLIHPDYRIIAEVSLTALGFTQPISMSSRIVSLFSLAKDSNCLPEFLCDYPVSWLPVLKNVITVAGVCLQHACGAEKNEKEVIKNPELTSPDKLEGQALPSHHKHTSPSSLVMRTIVEEQAVVKGVTSVVFSTLFDTNKASQFCAILEDIFPGVCSLPFYPQCMEEVELSAVRAAVTDELQVTGLQTDPTVLCNALSLYQALKHDRVVFLVGQPGSGKTACYRALAGALRRLAAKEEVGWFNEDHGNTASGTDLKQNLPSWMSVDTVIIFPNSLSYQELWGGLCERHQLWRDGTVTEVLRRSERQDVSTGSSEKNENKMVQNAKWVILDGEPFSQPSWLDPFITISKPEDPFLSLPTGEKIHPSKTRVRILVELTTLEDASPSVVAHCSQVYHSGKDMWKSVWKTELEALYREDSLDLETLNMWNQLSEDLFASTLSFLRDQALTSGLPDDLTGKSRKQVVQGLQEVMSFSRILKAFLVLFGKGTGQTVTPRMTDKTEEGVTEIQHPNMETPSSEHKVQMRNLFAVAYIWGFGGHLHPRHWLQYDAFVREALYSSRYRVEVPAGGTVFQHFISEGLRWDTSTDIYGTVKRRLYNSYPIIPQYQNYAYLLETMLEACQPALLVGEEGSGKTTLCRSLLSQKSMHLRLPASPLLKAAELRRVLEHLGCQRTQLSSPCANIQQAGWLLFVDDIHCAPCDVSGKTSMALETLRQCMSQGGVLTSHRYPFKLFSSGAISYLATCSMTEMDRQPYGRVTSRLSRLFSIFVLPCLEEETLFSIHYPRLQAWLNKFQTLHQSANLAGCIISSTFQLYCAIRDKFPSSAERPHFLFSHWDLQKVFQGMCLWSPQNTNEHSTNRKASSCFPVTPFSSSLHSCTTSTSGPVANVLNVVRLWMHECLRTFGDRLCSTEENEALMLLLTEVSERTLSDWVQSQLLQHINQGEPCTINPTPLSDRPYLKCRNRKEEDRMTSQDESSSELRNKNTEVAKLEESLDEGTMSSSSIRLSGNEVPSLIKSSSKNCDNTLFKGHIGETMADIRSKGPEAEPLSQPVPSNVEIVSTSCFSANKETNSLNRLDWRTSANLVDGYLQNTEACISAGIQQSPVISLLSLDVLRGMQATVHDAVFSPEFLNLLSSSAQQGIFKQTTGYMEQDLDLLIQQLVSILKSQAMEEPDSKSRGHGCAVHGQRVRQLAHVLRALLISCGHGVLFATAKGTGRKTTVRLAAHLMGYQLLEVHSGNETMLPNILREARTHTRLQGGNVVLLVHEDISQDIRDKILLVMANGTFPDLYSKEELITLTQKINVKIKKSQNRPRDLQGLGQFSHQVQQNMHVFLLMSMRSGGMWRQAGEAAWGSISKALTLCCLVELYQPWTTQSLTEVAVQHLQEFLQTTDEDLKVDRTGFLTTFPQAFAGIHQSVLGYASTLLPHSHLFGPQIYEDLMECFIYMCRHLKSQCQRESHRMAAVLSRMKRLTDEAEKYSQDVLALRARLSEVEQDRARLRHEVEVKRAHCSCTQHSCQLEEKRLAYLEERVRNAHMQSQDAFQQVKPMYETALEAVRSLSQTDLNEVRRYRCPPDGVIAVMDAVCLLFNSPSNWENCQQLLGQPNFFQELEFYDCSRVTDDMFEALNHMVRRPELQPEVVREASRASESLCRWVHAVHHYTSVYRHVAPLEESRAQMEARVRESQARLYTLQLHKEMSEQELEDAEHRLEDVQRRLEELATLLGRAETLEGDAAAVVRQVERNVMDWNDAAEKVVQDSRTLKGDALILAAAITYLGPFGPDMRSELLEKWCQLCQSGRIDGLPEDPRRTFIRASDPHLMELVSFTPIPIAKDVLAMLCRAMDVAQDKSESAETVLLKLILWGHRGPFTQRCPLLTNMQQRSAAELKSVEKRMTGIPKMKDCRCLKMSEYESVISADDPTMLKNITQSAEKGQTVLVTQLERACRGSDLLDFLVHSGDSRTSLPDHPRFHLTLSTPLTVQSLLQEIHPSILAEVHVIDLSLSTAEVQELVLMEMLQSECPQLWTRHCQVEMDRHILLGQLRQEETTLMDYILESITPLGEDLEFLPRVCSYQNTASRLQAQLVELTQEAEGHRPLLAAFRRVAELAAAIYGALQEVARLCPFYHFPLCSFVEVLQGALVQQGHPDLHTRGEVETSACVEKISLQMAHLVLQHYRGRLFEDHTSLLRLLVSVALCQYNEGFSEIERVAFLQGLEPEPLTRAGRCAPSPSLTPHPVFPAWVPTQVQANIHHLERLPAFEGLASSLQACPQQWKDYLRLPSSTVVGPVPCSTHAHLSTLQRALLWRTLLPQSLSAVADDLAACQLGLTAHHSLAGGPWPSSPMGLSGVMHKTKGPVILILPGQKERRWPQVYSLSWLKQAAENQNDKKGVIIQVVTFGEKCQKEAVLTVLEVAVQEGHWLVFNNCHLLDQWDEDVLCQLTQLVSCIVQDETAADPNEGVRPRNVYCRKQIHPNFRLWFVTEASSPLSVPAAVRVHGTHLVCRSSWELKEVLSYALPQAMSAAAAASTHPSEPLLRCAILHSVLLQRQAYGHLGQGHLYSWSHEDLQALLDAQVQLANCCANSDDALEYIAADLVYGGHIDDAMDLESVEAVAKACLRTPAAKWGRGPHTLADLIKNIGRFGSVEQLKELTRSCDPVLLGFSSGLAVELVREQSRSLSLLLQQLYSPWGVASGSTAMDGGLMMLPDLQHARRRLQALKDALGQRKGHEIPEANTATRCPLQTFFQQEWDRLVQLVSSLLSSLTQPIQTSKHSSSPSFTLLGLSGLEKQAELLTAYLWDRTLPAYRLSAFLNPRGLLGALVRVATLTEKKDICDISLNFQVLGAGVLPASPPASGLYLCGLELQGVLWDSRLGALRETLSPQPCPLPILWVTAETMDPENPPFSNSSSEPLYLCPIYVEEAHKEAGWDLAERNIVTRVPLMTKLDPTLCALRRARLLSTLPD